MGCFYTLSDSHHIPPITLVYDRSIAALPRIDFLIQVAPFCATMVSVGANKLLSLCSSNRLKRGGEDQESNSSFSVLISVYASESAISLREALISVINQSTVPDEVVLVKDGPLSEELDKTIEDLTSEYPDLFTIVSINRNVGLGRALNIGLKYCSNSLVARMDADDVSIKNRFSLQLQYLQKNPHIALVGGYMCENSSSGDSFIREVPIDPEKVEDTAHIRNPLNHPTVMFRKDAVTSVGGYRDLYSIQDYDLWVRMLTRGYKLANIPNVLVTTDKDADYYQRRGGRKYLKDEIRVQKNFFDYEFLTLFEMIRNLLIRAPVRLLPNKIRSKLYQFVLRDPPLEQLDSSRKDG